MCPNSSTTNSTCQTSRRTGFIAAVALHTGRVLGAYRDGKSADSFDLVYADEYIDNGVPDPITLTVDDIPQIVRLLEDASAVMEGGE